jgi:hypothetical protein|uniref:Antitoxin n=1 Tax=Siphoviridae sp. ct6bb17 TaxID=2825345 RepID=A0A8S5NXU8_9CAUD|nr:MAG TPA: antitoxin [Siphoviridae sp. ct6bb17]
MEETIQDKQINVINTTKPNEIKISRGHGGAAIVRVDSEAADILEEFANKSQLSIQKLASNFIKFAGERTIIKFDD